nr:MAG TPA: hypothetical protein [Caudoviricetes sp.]
MLKTGLAPAYPALPAGGLLTELTSCYLTPSHNITHLTDFNKYYKLTIEAKVSRLYDLL